ncbi:helix-turn-helix transcriptional regulator [Kineococcus sp. G2]|uniref:helix-turn-helix transcriptional regulator n=1 Tax=Kineococcus sp. G2 TaxID=3127484 RepID=UPI00301C7A52
MVFDDDEVIALIAGLRMAESGFASDAATRAIAKLRTVLPRKLATLAEEVVDHTETVRLDEPAHDEDLLAVLTTAAAADLAVRFTYRDQHGRETRRQVDSSRCVVVRGRWLLLAYDLGREDWRTFRVDRVRDVETGSPAVRRSPPAADLADWLRTDFGRNVR